MTHALQFDMFAILEPPPPAPVWTPPPTHIVETRAGPIRVRDDERDPFEVEVRGIWCVVDAGLGSRVIGPPGSPFWSETGFRSFGYATDDPDEARAVIETYIARPVAKGGLGGKLTRWWPGYVLQWRDSLAFELSCARDRATVWAQWGPEKHAEHWANHDAKLAAAVARMVAEGIDPNEVGPPSHFKGKWPRVDC